MIVYVSPAEMNGGILQFSITMLEKTCGIEECRLFLPSSINKSDYKDLEDKIISYEKVKTVFSHNNGIKKIASMIAAQNPDKIVFLEDSLLMQQLNDILRKDYLTAMVVHDVIQHPYRNMSKRKVIVEVLRRTWMKKTVSKENRIILLSQNSKKYFDNLYKNRKAKTLVMRLGAHVPAAEMTRPSELVGMGKKYFLFFGRIDKYKGIANLFCAYEKLPEEFRDVYHLVIAGKGALSEEEKKYAEADEHIHTITRFTEDGEMNWLFANSTAVVMPYIEASQSGVLPITYHFSKPAIVSDQPGLMENVVDGKTGYIVHSIDELADKMKKIVGQQNDQMIQNVEKYYKNRFLWENNITQMLESLEK